MYKLLVLDLDDTLLDNDREISTRNKEAIMRAQNQGVKVVLASGRPTCAMVKYSDELKLEQYDSYMISFNGGEIVKSGSREILFEKTLEIEEAHKLYEFSRKKNCDIITYHGLDLVTEDDSEYIDVEIELLNVPVRRVKSFCDAINYTPVKCILLQEPTYLKKIESVVKTEFPDLSASISKPFFLEVTAHDIDKGHTLDRLCRIEGISKDEVIAIGNAENDLSMINYAGLGIWVENADKELISDDHIVTASNCDDGVALAIEKYILN